MQREWALACDAPDLPACVAGWELPGQDGKQDGHRAFEAVWSVDPAVVRSAARIATSLAETALPGQFTALQQRLAERAPPSSPDLRRASGLLERALDYLARDWTNRSSE